MEEINQEIPDWMYELPVWIYHAPIFIQFMDDDMSDNNLLNYEKFLLDMIRSSNVHIRSNGQDVNWNIIPYFHNLLNFHEEEVTFDKCESLIYVLDFLNFETLPAETLYIFENVDINFISTFNYRTGRDLAIISEILVFKKMFTGRTPRIRFYRSIRTGKLDYVKYLKYYHLRNNPDFVFADHKLTTRAARYHNIDIFEFFISNNCPYNFDDIFEDLTLYTETKDDEKMIEFFRYLRQKFNKIFDHIDEIKVAILREKLCYVKYLKGECGYDFTTETFWADYALEKRVMQIFEYFVIDLQCPFNHDLSEDAFNGLTASYLPTNEIIECLQKLNQKFGIRFNTHTKYTTIAAKKYHLGLLQYLIGINCPYNSWEIHSKIIYSSLADDEDRLKPIIRYLHELPWIE